MCTSSAVHLALLVVLNFHAAVSTVDGDAAAQPRQKRFLIFPRANPQRLQMIGGFGIPADIQLESVTMGYVFKSVYLLPWNSSHWIPPFLDRHELETERVLRRRAAVPTTMPPLVLAPQSHAEPPYERYDGRWQELDAESLLPSPPEQPGRSPHQQQQHHHSRWTFYRMLEQLFEQKGFDGRSCVLRAICEASEARFTHTSGLIGELLHIAFTPSATEDAVAEPHHSLYGLAETVPDSMSASSGQSVCAAMYAECSLSLLGSFSDVFG
uniref:Uncharacterized protein n=1 Tax=Anopheles melas TaxID=34690 RepID=A0A182TNS4_9DIPT